MDCILLEMMIVLNDYLIFERTQSLLNFEECVRLDTFLLRKLTEIFLFALLVLTLQNLFL